MPPRPPPAAFAREVVRRVLGADVDLDAAVTDAGQLEASVRWIAGGAPRGGRLMIEAAPFEAVRALAQAIGVALPPLAMRLADLAREERLPLIGGCDVSAGTPLVKLYLNASDASAELRRRLRDRAGIAAGPEAPHVIGLNARRDGELGIKLYQQGEDEARLATTVASAIPFATTLAGAGVSAGAVVCWDVEGESAKPRAFFVATRRDAGDAVARVVSALPGFDAAAVAEALPFAPGPVRSIGVTGRDPAAFTLYFKPDHSVSPVAALEPSARYRAGAGEIGVFVEPLARAGRAYARTARHAISYRCREGSPDRPDVEALMRWVTGRVRSAEESGSKSPLETLRTSAPPSPWHAVDE